MIAGLGRREQIIVAGGIVVIVLVFGWIFGLQPVIDRRQLLTEQVAAREQALVGRLSLVARRGAITAELEATDRRLEQINARLLVPAAPAVAASELQRMVKDLAAAAGTEVRSERILPSEERGDLLEIPLEVAVGGDIRHLVDFLARLESAPKLMLVKDLRVRVLNIAQPRDLLATVTISGFVTLQRAKA